MKTSIASRCLAAWLVVALLALCAMPARAQGGGTAVVTQFEWTQGGERLRLTIDGTPQSEIILLRNPPRVAIDLSDTLALVRPDQPGEAGPVASVRDGLTGADRYRLLFDLREPAVPVFTTGDSNGKTVLELTFEPSGAAGFERAVAERAGRKVRPGPAGPDAPAAGEKFTIVLDPGHGGADYGAVGEGGTLEKELNLSFATILREALEKEGEAVEIVMTRDGDQLVPLAERSAMARRAGADLFVSIHADSIRHRELRGATVYTLSLNASDQLARELAESENAADRFAGPEWTQDTPEIHDILVDLVQRETEHLSQRFASELVLQMRAADIRLINNPKRSAGFRVLMAPDVPSVLLEMGYLSNVEDEELMSRPEWQRETAAVVAGAIRAFLGAR